MPEVKILELLRQDQGYDCGSWVAEWDGEKKITDSEKFK